MSWPLMPALDRDAVAEAVVRGCRVARSALSEKPPLLTLALAPAAARRLRAATVCVPTVPLG